MSVNKPIRRVAVVGTGVIGASWAAFYLSRGFDVVATNPAPTAEADLRKYVDNAWSVLARAGLPAGASRERLKFTASMSRALAEAELVQETPRSDTTSRSSSSPRWTRPPLQTRSSRRAPPPSPWMSVSRPASTPSVA